VFCQFEFDFDFAEPAERSEDERPKSGIAGIWGGRSSDVTGELVLLRPEETLKSLSLLLSPDASESKTE
jgi:hypothetical protein